MSLTLYPWQKSQWQTLTAAMEQQRLPHALLFHGAQGMGKFDFAKAFAASLLCEKRLQAAWPCGQCRGCQLRLADSHPDLFIVTPEEKSKVIKVDQVRALIDKLNTTSQRSGRQVVLLYPAESMNRAAANSLLKTLEEPAGDVVLILVAHQVGSLPATIVSRCQRTYFAASDDADTINWVQEKLGQKFDPLLLLRMADYAPLRALELAQTDYLGLRDNILKHMLQITRDHTNPVAPVGGYVKHDLELLLYALLTLAMDVARLQLGAQVGYVVNQDRTEPLQALGKTLRATLLQNFIGKIQRAYQLFVAGTHVNVQLLLENLFIEWATLG